MGFPFRGPGSQSESPVDADTPSEHFFIVIKDLARAPLLEDVKRLVDAHCGGKLAELSG